MVLALCQVSPSFIHFKFPNEWILNMFMHFVFLTFKSIHLRPYLFEWKYKLCNPIVSSAHFIKCVMCGVCYFYKCVHTFSFEKLRLNENQMVLHGAHIHVSYSSFIILMMIVFTIISLSLSLFFSIFYLILLATISPSFVRLQCFQWWHAPTSVTLLICSVWCFIRMNATWMLFNIRINR